MGHSASIVYKQKVAEHDLSKETPKKPILFNRAIKEYDEKQ